MGAVGREHRAEPVEIVGRIGGVLKVDEPFGARKKKAMCSGWKAGADTIDQLVQRGMAGALGQGIEPLDRRGRNRIARLLAGAIVSGIERLEARLRAPAAALDRRFERGPVKGKAPEAASAPNSADEITLPLCVASASMSNAMNLAD
jgi:hypothetical protein